MGRARVFVGRKLVLTEMRTFGAKQDNWGRTNRDREPYGKAVTCALISREYEGIECLVSRVRAWAECV
jgi:hypothetical protein